MLQQLPTPTTAHALISAPFQLSAAIEAADTCIGGLFMGDGPPSPAAAHVHFQSPPPLTGGHESGVLGEFLARGVVPVDVCFWFLR